MSLRDVKEKIRSIDRTRKVTKAMETVSAVKMRKSQLRAFTSRPYARAALSILERLSSSLAVTKHPLTVARTVSSIALVVVTSDKGLCGVLNSAVLRKCEAVIAESGLQKENILIYAFGKKAAEYFDRRGYIIKSRMENISDEVPLDELATVSAQLTTAFEGGEVDQVLVVYTNFKSTFEQEALSHTLLPFSVEQFRSIVVGILPTKGAFSGGPTLDSKVGPRDLTPPAFYTVEPSPEEVLAELVPRLTSVFLFHMLLESKASEHSARMIAMKNASDKSRDLSKALNRSYNKARQAVITREVSEIVGGIEAMASN